MTHIPELNRTVKAYSGKPVQTARERFWAYVDRGGMGGCWNWLGSIGSGGYGHYKPFDKRYSAHRFSWGLHREWLQDGDSYGKECVLHKCDNPRCVNPDHLYLGNHLDNMRDRKERGREPKTHGSLNGRAKLSETDVIEIRGLYARGDMRHIDLAERYNVSEPVIWKILNNYTWRHI